MWFIYIQVIYNHLASDGIFFQNNNYKFLIKIKWETLRIKVFKGCQAHLKLKKYKIFKF